MATEHVLLRSPNLGSRPYFATVPAGAALHDVPDRDDIPEEIRGLAFKRTGYIDPDTKLATFRKRERQV